MKATTLDLQQIKQACEKSLYFLCTQMLGYSDWDIVHDDMERDLARPANKKLILVPRGHLKTSMITIGKSIQYILNDPNVRILIANQVWDKARDMLSAIKESLEDKSDLPKLYGNFVSEEWNQDQITIRQRTKAFKEATITTTGVEAETTGGHYDIIILDDLQGLQNYQTPEQREKVKKFYRSMMNLLEPGSGRMIVIGTRWHQDDVYANIIEKESAYYDIVVRRVVENGRVIFPKKFNLKFDKERKCWVNVTEPCLDYIHYLKHNVFKEKPGEFSSQYMNEPIAEEDQKFKPSYFKYFDRTPERLFTGMTVDFAIGQRKESDYTAINVMGMDSKRDLFVLDRFKGHWGVSEIISNIIAMYKKWKPDVVGVESNGFQLTIKEGLEYAMRANGIYISIQELKHGSDRTKELRIEALEPFYRNGHIWHAKSLEGSEFEDELVAFPKGRHDDEIDAASMQLELLIPGDEESHKPINPNSWEAAFLDARKANTRYNDFFREVVNG